MRARTNKVLNCAALYNVISNYHTNIIASYRYIWKQNNKITLVIFIQKFETITNGFKLERRCSSRL